MKISREFQPGFARGGNHPQGQMLFLSSTVQENSYVLRGFGVNCVGGIVLRGSAANFCQRLSSEVGVVKDGTSPEKRQDSENEIPSPRRRQNTPLDKHPPSVTSSKASLHNSARTNIKYSGRNPL